MKASQQVQEQLLALQKLDIRIQQIDHRLAALPEDTELAGLAEQDRGYRAELAAANNQLDAVNEIFQKLNSDSAVTEARQARNRERVDSSSSAKDIVALTAELETLATRLAELESRQFEAMEQVEVAEQAVRSIEQLRLEITERSTILQSSRSAHVAELHAERAEVNRKRSQIDIPAELLNVYENRREHSAGVGAALLQHQSCGGCTMSLTGSDLAKVRAAVIDEVLFCPDCDRILVRTNESGL